MQEVGWYKHGRCNSATLWDNIKGIHRILCGKLIARKIFSWVKCLSSLWKTICFGCWLKKNAAIILRCNIWRTFKKIILLSLTKGWLKKDPFAEYKFTLEAVDRDFFEDSEIQRILSKEIAISRLARCVILLSFVALPSWHFRMSSNWSRKILSKIPTGLSGSGKNVRRPRLYVISLWGIFRCRFWRSMRIILSVSSRECCCRFYVIKKWMGTVCP